MIMKAHTITLAAAVVNAMTLLSIGTTTILTSSLIIVKRNHFNLTSTNPISLAIISILLLIIICRSKKTKVTFHHCLRILIAL